MRDVVADLNARRLRVRRSVVRAVRRVSLSRASAPSTTTASRSSCARRSSRGTCSARRSAAPARRATSIRRSSACRSRSTRHDRRAARASTCNGRALPLTPTGVPRRIRRRRALPRVEPAVGAASDDRRAGAAGLRSRRHLGGARARRLHLSRRASGRPQLRHVPGQRQRGRGAPRRALLGARPHARADRTSRRSRRIRRRRRRSTCAGSRTG